MSSKHRPPTALVLKFPFITMDVKNGIGTTPMIDLTSLIYKPTFAGLCSNNFNRQYRWLPIVLEQRFFGGFYHNSQVE